MKRTIYVFLFTVFAVSLYNSAPAEIDKFSSKVAVINFETEVIDYGTITQNSDGLRLFKFTNNGDAPLLITDVKTTCGCTVPRYSKAPILPGNFGELEIKYNTKKLGAFTKSITVISNAEGGNKVLKIKGNVVVAK